MLPINIFSRILNILGLKHEYTVPERRNIACDISKYEQLNRPFKIIAFDWDGTAVINRKVDASAVTSRIKDLLDQNVLIFVVTGTNFDNINRQFSSLISGNSKQNLYVCTNRGSEVYGFDQDSNPVLLHRLNASKQDDQLMDKVVERTKQEIEGISNAKVNIIYDRMNRRKLDLIPEWEDPQKSEIGNLLVATQKRLDTNGFAGGVNKAFKLMADIAKTSGFGRAKITSDVKHLEIGLTDKSDSIRWMLQNLARARNIANEDILIGGDEFGPIAGFEGSDDKMVIRNEPGITYFSVGIEPNGVPSPVIYIGGGPDCFINVLENQINLNRGKADSGR